MNPAGESHFLLNVTLTRPDVVDWLRTIPEDNLAKVVENTIAAGNLVLSMLQASAGEESMRRFFRPVVDRMDELKGIIEGLLRATQKSQRLGEMGENLVAEQLKNAFPGDTFTVVSQEGHQADIHAHFMIADRDPPKALIEVKLYSGDVPSQEVDKFQRDLEETGVRYGLMVSLTSRITGILGLMHLDISPKHIGIYVPNAGLDGHALVCGASLLKAIAAFEARAGATRIPADAIEQAWSRLTEEIKEIESIATDVSRLQDGLRGAQENVHRIFGSLIESAMAANVRLRYSLDRLTCRLSEELAALPHVPDGQACVKPAEPDAILNFLKKLDDESDPRVKVFRELYDLAGHLGLGIASDGDHWKLLRGGQLFGRTSGTRNRLDIVLKIDDQDSISLRPRLEKIVANEIVINGSDPKEMFVRLQRRLAVDDGICASDGP